FFLLRLLTPSSPLFPYTTLFRSDTWISPILFTESEYKIECSERSRGISLDRLRMLNFVTTFGGQSWHRIRLIDANLQKFENPFADRKSTRLNSSHVKISYAVFCL